MVNETRHLYLIVQHLKRGMFQTSPKKFLQSVNKFREIRSCTSSKITMVKKSKERFTVGAFTVEEEKDCNECFLDVKPVEHKVQKRRLVHSDDGTVYKFKGSELEDTVEAGQYV